MILMIDNYDSFTWNLVQMLAGAGEQVEVVRNDAAQVDEMLARRPLGIVVSPGPGRPEGAGVCVELIRRGAPVPLLGVCLGHQALAFACGGVVERAGRQMHGKTSRIRHRDEGIFAGLPNPFEATRYHSLSVREEALPAELRAVAWSEDDGEVMGIVHRELPYYGVQFHPESVLTAAGPHLLGNFLDACRSWAAAASTAAGSVAADIAAGTASHG
ncbi:MAG TPA: aminodeoxychorismate/anthranilate synthase component II [Thermoanaerobaculia bacterium]|jgi:anthranilate synthase component 2|nr:aminodeoxychorismate/anthranilate synthase component II [Thermoanaerobaculia bacterium]